MGKSKRYYESLPFISSKKQLVARVEICGLGSFFFVIWVLNINSVQIEPDSDYYVRDILPHRILKKIEFQYGLKYIDETSDLSDSIIDESDSEDSDDVAYDITMSPDIIKQYMLGGDWRKLRRSYNLKISLGVNADVQPARLDPYSTCDQYIIALISITKQSYGHTFRHMEVAGFRSLGF
ncbi:hypothetical protein PIB30_095226 [Stylosanthes scabra]|uniref:Uncharacterized protein n=1 Tax=Stylosanthes scabra TaxID=79078 RepID=A0ABU6RWN2_9FABA|nr:hypothetical protein [Stylosanthes scabra]